MYFGHLIIGVLLNYTERKKRAKMALLESNFENQLSFVGESHFFLHNHVMELHRELSYGQPNGSARRAILALFFSQCKTGP